MVQLSQPLTNVQLEILKAFSYDLNAEELLDFRRTFARYFAERTIQAANQTWDNQGWNDQKVDELLNTKLRKGK